MSEAPTAIIIEPNPVVGLGFQRFLFESGWAASWPYQDAAKGMAAAWQERPSAAFIRFVPEAFDHEVSAAVQGLAREGVRTVALVGPGEAESVPSALFAGVIELPAVDAQWLAGMLARLQAA